MQKLKRVQEIFLVVLLLLIIGCGKEPVLDDYVSECHEVHKYNPWLNYGYPLHL